MSLYYDLSATTKSSKRDEKQKEASFKMPVVGGVGARPNGLEKERMKNKEKRKRRKPD